MVTNTPNNLLPLFCILGSSFYYDHPIKRSIFGIFFSFFLVVFYEVCVNDRFALLIVSYVKLPISTEVQSDVK
jgi:hypothetical protein